MCLYIFVEIIYEIISYYLYRDGVILYYRDTMVLIILYYRDTMVLIRVLIILLSLETLLNTRSYSDLSPHSTIRTRKSQGATQKIT